MQIFFEFESHPALVQEFESNLSKARAFVPGEWDVEERQKVELVLVHPLSGEWMPLAAEVVYIAPAEPSAVGLEMVDWGPEKAKLVHAFVGVPESNPLSLVSPESLAAERFEVDGATPKATVSHGGSNVESGKEPLQLSVRSPEPLSESGYPAESPRTAPGVAPPHVPPPPLVPSEGEGTVEGDGTKAGESAAPPMQHPASQRPSVVPRASEPPPKNVQERVRRLNMRERDTMARTGNLSERVALERAYGAAVWDALLSNAALTGPEVARIAKNGNATIPHLKLIVGNPAWLSKGEVRRALLTNPRLPAPQIERVLRALPGNELKKIPKQTAYSPKVRAVAQRMSGRA